MTSERTCPACQGTHPAGSTCEGGWCPDVITSPRRSRPSRARHLAVHVCGWAKPDGVWRCIQDYYAEGYAPETGCGAVWASADLADIAATTFFEVTA